MIQAATVNVVVAALERRPDEQFRAKPTSAFFYSALPRSAAEPALRNCLAHAAASASRQRSGSRVEGLASVHFGAIRFRPTVVVTRPTQIRARNEQSR